jgi:hypothetical protein
VLKNVAEKVIAGERDKLPTVREFGPSPRGRDGKRS